MSLFHIRGNNRYGIHCEGLIGNTGEDVGIGSDCRCAKKRRLKTPRHFLVGVSVRSG